jgi:hypothetical protein
VRQQQCTCAGCGANCELAPVEDDSLIQFGNPSGFVKRKD